MADLTLNDEQFDKLMKTLGKAISNANKGSGLDLSYFGSTPSSKEGLEKELELLKRYSELISKGGHRGKAEKEELKNLQKILKLEGQKLSKAEREKKIKEAQQRLNEKELEYRQAGITKLDEYTEKLEKQFAGTRKGFRDIKRGISDITSSVKKLMDTWGKIDQASANYAKSIGMSVKGMNAMRKNFLDTVVNKSFGTKYNISTEELLKISQQYASAVGRNITVGAPGLENFAAMTKLMGNEGATEFLDKLENFGVSMREAGDRTGKMFKTASKYGISFEKYSKNFLSNIKLAQNYTFKNGLKGLEDMAAKATELRLDMGQVSSFADKVNTVEGAISTGAQLQVLGGAFSQLANPIGMMYESMADMEGLQDRMIKMFSGMGSFNKETGEVNVSAFNKMRIRAAASAMGVDYSNIMESINASARGNEIEKQARKNGALNNDMIKMLRNVGVIENGKAGAYINGEWKNVSSMSNNDAQELKKLQQTESEDIKEIATTLRGMNDIIEGNQKQLNDRIAKYTDGMNKLIKNIVGDIKLVSGIIAGVGIAVVTSELVKISLGIIKIGNGVASILNNLIGNANKGNFNDLDYGPKGKGKGKGRLKAGAALGIAGMGLQAVNSTLVASGVYGKDSGWDIGMDMAGGALSGGAIGAMIGGPWGAFAGVVIGVIPGLLRMIAKNTEQKRDGKQKDLEKIIHAKLNGSYSEDELRGIMYRVKNDGRLTQDEINGLSEELVKKLKENGDLETLKIRHDARGGFVSGPGTATSDSIPAMLSNGESVMTAKATKMFGPQLSAMNIIGGGRGFKDGGKITPDASKTASILSVSPNSRLSPSYIEPSPKNMDLNVNVSGTIKLDLGNKSKLINASELMNDYTFKDALRNIVLENLNRTVNGGAYSPNKGFMKA